MLLVSCTPNILVGSILILIIRINDCKLVHMCLVADNLFGRKRLLPLRKKTLIPKSWISHIPLSLHFFPLLGPKDGKHRTLL